MKSDFILSVGLGLERGWYPETKFGRAASLSAVTKTTVAPFVPVYLTAASLVRIKVGGNAADDSAGTGAQSIWLRCLDANFNKVLFKLVTNGASVSANSTIAVMRVLSVWVDDVGSGLTNAADITIEAVTGGSTQAIVPAAEGQTLQCHTTVPAGHTGFIVAKEFSLIDTVGAGTTQHLGHFRIETREFGKSWRTRYNSGLDTDGSNNHASEQPLPIKVGEKSDIKMTAYSHVVASEANAQLFIIHRNDSVV